MEPLHGLLMPSAGLPVSIHGLVVHSAWVRVVPTKGLPPMAGMPVLLWEALPLLEVPPTAATDFHTRRKSGCLQDWRPRIAYRPPLVLQRGWARQVFLREPVAPPPLEAASEVVKRLPLPEAPLAVVGRTPRFPARPVLA